MPKAEHAYSRAAHSGSADPDIQNSYAGFLCRTGKTAAGEKLFNEVARNPVYQTPQVALVNAGSAPASLAVGASFGLQVDYSPNAVGLQYALLDVELFAVAKAAIVFGGTLIASWGAMIAMRRGGRRFGATGPAGALQGRTRRVETMAAASGEAGTAPTRIID